MVFLNTGDSTDLIIKALATVFIEIKVTFISIIAGELLSIVSGFCRYCTFPQKDGTGLLNVLFESSVLDSVVIVFRVGEYFQILL